MSMVDALKTFNYNLKISLIIDYLVSRSAYMFNYSYMYMYVHMYMFILRSFVFTVTSEKMFTTLVQNDQQCFYLHHFHIIILPIIFVYVKFNPLLCY